MKRVHLATFFSSSAVRSRVFHLVMKEHECVSFVIPPQHVTTQRERHPVAMLIPVDVYEDLVTKANLYDAEHSDDA